MSSAFVPLFVIFLFICVSAFMALFLPVTDDLFRRTKREVTLHTLKILFGILPAIFCIGFYFPDDKEISFRQKAIFFLIMIVSGALLGLLYIFGQ